jgi:hypothetical protein
MGSSFSWRLPFILLACYSIAFSALTLVYLPPSPRWLTIHGKAGEAAAAWEKLDVPAADQEKILGQLNDSMILTANTEIVSQDGLQRHTTATSRRSERKAQILDAFSSESRPRLFLAVFLMGMQQLSGIDGVLYVRSPIPSTHGASADLTLVRSHPLPTSRSSIERVQVPGFWCLCARHLRRHHSRDNLG